MYVAVGSGVVTAGLGWLIGLFFLAVLILAFFILVFFDLVFFDLRFLAMRLPLCIYSSHRRLHNSHCTVSASYGSSEHTHIPAMAILELNDLWRQDDGLARRVAIATHELPPHPLKQGTLSWCQ